MFETSPTRHRVDLSGGVCCKILVQNLGPDGNKSSVFERLTLEMAGFRKVERW